MSDDDPNSPDLAETFHELLLQEGAPLVESFVIAEASATMLDHGMPVGHDNSLISLGLLCHGYMAARPVPDKDHPPNGDKTSSWYLLRDDDDLWLQAMLLDKPLAVQLHATLSKLLAEGVDDGEDLG